MLEVEEAVLVEGLLDRLLLARLSAPHRGLWLALPGAVVEVRDRQLHLAEVKLHVALPVEARRLAVGILLGAAAACQVCALLILPGFGAAKDGSDAGLV